MVNTFFKCLNLGGLDIFTLDFVISNIIFNLLYVKFLVCLRNVDVSNATKSKQIC